MPVLFLDPPKAASPPKCQMMLYQPRTRSIRALLGRAEPGANPSLTYCDAWTPGRAALALPSKSLCKSFFSPLPSPLLPFLHYLT